VAWFEVLQNAIDYHSTSKSISTAKKNWFASTFLERKKTIYTRVTGSLISLAAVPPSQLARASSQSASGPDPQSPLSPIRNKYLSRLLPLTRGRDEDEDDDDDDDDDQQEGGLHKTLYNNSIGLLTSTFKMKSNSFERSSSSATAGTATSTGTAKGSRKPPPAPQNSPIVSINKKARTPPIFTVPYKTGE
jgi:hypothetical protein